MGEPFVYVVVLSRRDHPNIEVGLTYPVYEELARIRGPPPVLHGNTVSDAS